MCGRFAFYSPVEATAALFGAETSAALNPRYNIAPTQDIPAVRNTDTDRGRELVLLRWGLVPFWAKDPSIGNRMINARAETVAEKPAFRAAYRRRRCVVLADGIHALEIDDPLVVSHRRALAVADVPPAADRVEPEVRLVGERDEPRDFVGGRRTHDAGDGSLDLLFGGVSSAPYTYTGATAGALWVIEGGVP